MTMNGHNVTGQVTDFDMNCRKLFGHNVTGQVTDFDMNCRKLFGHNVTGQVTDFDMNCRKLLMLKLEDIFWVQVKKITCV